MTNRRPYLPHPRHVVTAILVAHDGGRWLPTTLQAVKMQRRPVQRFVAVDTGSRDDTRQLLEESVGAASVLSAPRTVGFGDAVHQAVAAFAGVPGWAASQTDAGSPVEWLWLLHDDSAPDPAALDAMLALADEMPSAAVIGPKIVDWERPGVLREVGFTVDRGGHRQTGLEPDELDHGQHDGDRDVFAVSSAGMLIRRDLWDLLGGFDRNFPLLRDDLDFCWRAHLAGERVVVCTRAVVRHARAATSGYRRVSCTPPGARRSVSLRRLDRQAALFAWLANCSRSSFPLVAVRLALAALLRALAFVAAKSVDRAVSELAAAAAVFGRPGRLLAARRQRRPFRRVPYSEVRALLAPRGSRLRQVIDQWTAASAPDDRRRSLRRLLTNPGVLLAVGLLAVTLAAERTVLTTQLWGGALLPAPAGAGDLWQRYVESWHATGYGSAAPAPPYLAVLAFLGSLLVGNARFAVAILLLGAAPLAGLVAYRSSRWAFTSPRLRVTAGALYGLAPVVTGAVSTGRLGVAVAAIVLPALLVQLARALVPEQLLAVPAGVRHGRRPASVRHAWAAGLLLAVLTAFDPAGYLLTAALLVIALVIALVRRQVGEAARCVLIAGIPALLLVPWTGWLWSHPALFVTGLGQVAQALQDSNLHPVDLVLAHPGGPGSPPYWLMAGVAAAALFGLFRSRTALLGWLLAAVGVAGGLVVTRVHVVPVAEPGGSAVAGWPGAATAFVAAGLALAAAGGLAGLRGWLRRSSFGLRHPATLLLAAAVLATPLVAAGTWIARGTGHLLRTGSADILPIFVTDPTTVHGQPRTVILRPAGNSVRYTVLRDRSPELGDADLPPSPAQVAAVGSAVGDLASGLGGPAADALARTGVRFVLIPASAQRLDQTIAAAGGLLRRGTVGGWQVWEITPGGARLAITDGTAWQPVTAGGVGWNAAPVMVSSGSPSRLLVLAEAASPRWRAVLGSPGSTVPLAPVNYQGWQAFRLPATGGEVRVYRVPDRRSTWLTVELAATAIVIFIALPGAPRRRATAAPAATPSEARVPVGAAP
ncbi:glycosyl transferase, family 2 [Acidothermus cellulolyticus 11B]|uniref:Glycosyl transferase, family 2 n=1 Tax=Acidothermus cellulolyticus (strain ATCC 43068 / DSM 8971 / 11B) TaxID=351607 RepID=A0LS24_ACIC1|nr:glycosyltransferase family 2 protein [Acidothermus cellulolyticus]ABK52234.1 glycosyl transferase, family 2 [Acidothermus cellulolyticus 11B]